MKNQKEIQKQAETRWMVSRNYRFQFSCEEAAARLIKIYAEAEGEKMDGRKKNEI